MKRSTETAKTATARGAKKARYVLVTTEFRGVFFGRVRADQSPDSITLDEARCAIYWGTTKGFLELAQTGPTKNSRIGAPVDGLTLFKVTSVTDVAQGAVRVWQDA